MAFIKKVLDWKGENLRTYKISSASTIEADASKIDWLGEKYAEQVGTTLDETLMNNIQKNGLFTVNSTHSIVNDTEFYTITEFDGINDFGIFDNLNIKFKVDTTNTKEKPYIKLNGNLYEMVKRSNQELVSLSKNEIIKNYTYNAVYKESKFIIENFSLLAQEDSSGLINIKTIKSLIKTEVPDATEAIKGISSFTNIIDYIDSKFNRFFTKIFPVGTIYTTTSSTFDPNVTFGGTWEKYAKGRTLMGVDTNDVNFNTGEKTGGSQTTTLGVGNLPIHNHSFNVNTTNNGWHWHTVNNHSHHIDFNSQPDWVSDSAYRVPTFRKHDTSNGAFPKGMRESTKTGVYYHDHWVDGVNGHIHQIAGDTWGSAPGTDGLGDHIHNVNGNTNNTGSNQAFSNLNPYITVYFWKRTK